MHRIILFGKSKRHTRTTFHLARAFKECGNTILWLNPAKIRRRRKHASDQWILKKIKAFNPDIIFIYSKDIPLGVLQKIAGGSVKIMMYYEDMWREIPTSLVQRGKLVNFFLVTNKGLLPDYKKAGIAHPIYFIGACDRHDHRSWEVGGTGHDRFALFGVELDEGAVHGGADRGAPEVILGPIKR